MKLLFTFDNKGDAEVALKKLVGDKRLASERDDTETVYNLFGVPSWGNFYRLGLFGLLEYENLMAARLAGLPYDEARRIQIISILEQVARQYEISVPSHWLV